MSSSHAGMSRDLTGNAFAPASKRWHAWDLALLMLIAAVIRLVLYNGPFGSDDVTYLARAAAIANGTWESANYNGALRYGFNIPAGMLMSVFGVSHFTANLWPLLCSLGEIALVYLLAAHIWNRKAGAFAALILSCMPLHTAVATRIHADSVVCFFVTASYVLFYFAERTRRAGLYFASGIAMGLVFWTKELGVIMLIPFAAYPLLVRRFEKAWFFVIAGGLVMLGLHLALMSAIAGDPLHLFKVVTGQLNRGFIGQSTGVDSPWYYFAYLFFDVRHTWLAPLFALGAIVLFCARHQGGGERAEGTRYVVFWCVGLLLVMSFLPVSLSPLRFAMKQSNYLTVFLAPLALLAGYQIAAMSPHAGRAVLALVLAGGLFLGALNQADYRGFTSNSKAAVQFAARHPKALVVGTANNSAMSASYAALGGNANVAPILSFKEMALPPDELQRRFGTAGKSPIYVVHDLENIDWMTAMPSLHKPLPCWRELERLTPTGFGASKSMVEAVRQVIDFIPLGLAQRLSARLAQLIRPKPALVYRVEGDDVWCGQKAPL